MRRFAALLSRELRGFAMIQFKVIGEDAAAIAADIAHLAECFGVVAGDVRFEHKDEHTIVGTATGRVALGESTP